VPAENEVLGKNLPGATLFTTNPTQLDLGLKPDHYGGKPLANHLSYGIAPHSCACHILIIINNDSNGYVLMKLTTLSVMDKCGS
jgi:hypothetical protein